MKKLLIVQYDTDDELHGLVVADPAKTLPNGNKEVIKILIGDYADEIYEELTGNHGKANNNTLNCASCDRFGIDCGTCENSEDE